MKKHLSDMVRCCSLVLPTPSPSVVGPSKVLCAVAQPTPPQNDEVSVGEESQVLKCPCSCGQIVLPMKQRHPPRLPWMQDGTVYWGLESGAVQKTPRASLPSEDHSGLSELQ